MLTKNILPQKRRRSREIAIQILYALDIRNSEKVNEMFSLYPFGDEEPDVVSYASSC